MKRLQRKIERYLDIPIFSIFAMYPRIKIYGWKYFFNTEYRVSIKKKIENKKQTVKFRTVYGGAYSANKARRVAFLLRRDGKMCQWCFLPLGKDITLDHIDTSKNKEGRMNSKLNNLRLMHKECNNTRGVEAMK
jgi:hypothetical protein